jgi:tRNA (cytosine38-C5)-methyltransferase
MTFPDVGGGTSDYVWRYIPGQLNWIDHGLHQAGPEVHGVMSALDDSVIPVNEYLDHDQGESCSHAIPDKVLLKYGRLFDIVLPSSKRTCCFTRGRPTNLCEP